MVYGVLRVIPPNLEKQKVEFPCTNVQAIMSFPGKKKVYVCGNNNNVGEKKIAK